MPMPKPQKDEKQGDYVSRCVRFVKGEKPGTPNEQANAMCFTAWRDRHKEAQEGTLPQPKGFGTLAVGEVPGPREKQYEFIPRCVKAVQAKNDTITDEEAGAICFMAWQCRYESLHPADVSWGDVSTADWSKVDQSRLPKECFLLTPSDDPKTWRVPVYEGAGGIDPQTQRFRERGLLNLPALRLVSNKHLPVSVKARAKVLRAIYETAPKTRYESYRTPDLQEAGDAPSRLVETVDFTGAEFVEGEDGSKTVKDVVLLGPVSSHGYEYKQEAMANAVGAKLYEGARIFINHVTGPRDLMHLAGTFQNTRHEGGKVKGDAQLLPDAYGLKFWHIAKTMPQAAGCSHVADGKLVQGPDGKKYVEAITRVHSVDLVVQGATTTNVFEGETPAGAAPQGDVMDLKDVKIEDLRTARPDLVRQLLQEGAATRDEEMQALIAEKQTLAVAKETVTQEKTKLAEEKTQLQAKLDEAAVREATRHKEAVVAKALAALPEQARTETFKGICLGVTTGKDGFDLTVFEAKVAELVKDRKALCEQAGVHGMGGPQERGGVSKTAAEIAEAAMAKDR